MDIAYEAPYPPRVTVAVLIEQGKCILILGQRFHVVDIVEDCGISRNTFYYHFEDMPALVEAVVLEEVDGIMRRYASISSMEECFDAAMQFCVGHT